MLKRLQKIGLSGKESEIYLALARKKESSANELAKATSTNRTVCYNTLQQLVDKGIVAYSKKDNKRIFSIAPPESLLADIREKEDIANELVKDLEKLRKTHTPQRSVEVFEGKNGLKQIFNEIRDCKELYVINATGLLFENLQFSAKHIMRDIEKSNKLRIIATQAMKKTELAKIRNAKIKYLPRSAENYATTFIFDGKVIIQTLKHKPFLVKITEDSIYDGYKKDFEVLWKRL
jgi:sugar-specific transcriptional regulator TrmB